MRIQKTPFMAMWGVLLAGLFLAVLTVMTAIQQPWFGMTLKLQDSIQNQTQDQAQDHKQAIVVDRVFIPQAGIASGQVVQAIQAADAKQVLLQPLDMIEDPDQLESYRAIHEFFARQQQLYQLMQQPFSIQFTDGSMVQLNVAASRPLNSLPAVFWVQIFVGLSSFLIGGWVWGLSRQRYTTFILFVAGCCIMAAAFAAAIYSTRVLALPAGLFSGLSSLNHSGAMLFSIVMLLLFANYPRRLLPVYIQAAYVLLMLCWWLADLFRVVFPGPSEGAFIPILLALSGMLVLALLQYRKAASDPVARAALRWFGLSLALGAGIPIVLMALPSLLGLPAAMPQGYAFVFFLLIYVGVVQGVARYKLFELDGWVFRILFYLIGALVLVLLDAVLIVATALDQAPAFGIAVISVAVIYLPLRDMLARRFASRKQVDRERLFQQVVTISLTPVQQDAKRYWLDLLENLFSPLRIDAVTEQEGSHIQIGQEGAILCLPAIARLPAVRMQYAARGRRLFSRQDMTLASELCDMLQYALQARDAYEQGVQQERQRIGRDLHDNIGAQLLTALQTNNQYYKDHMITETLTDLRHIIHDAMTGAQALEELAVELRRETAERSEAAGLRLDWPMTDALQQQVSARQAHAIRSVLREAVSNTIRHAQAHCLSIRLLALGDRLQIHICDDGIGMIATPASKGYGLNSMQARLQAFEGQLLIQPSQQGLSLQIDLPLGA